MPTRMPTGVVRQKKRIMVTMDPALNFACTIVNNKSEPNSNHATD
jgi:hypothetical protein